jgi:hypothetical protein
MSADNFDVEHVNDIDIYSIKTFNTDPKYIPIEKSPIDSRYNATRSKTGDVLHKYRRSDATLNPRDNSADQGNAGNADKNVINLKPKYSALKENSNTELFVMYKKMDAEFNSNVEIFNKHMSTLNQEILQAVEISKLFSFNS